MIAAIFLRNIKCYGNLNFIPLTQSPEEKLSIFTGENGSGKSTVLEALNFILNDLDPRNWEITLEQKKNVSHICPVFLIKKSQMKTSPQLEAISNSFWNLDLLQINRTKPIDQFFEWRKSLKNKINIDEYYLISIGKEYGGSIILTSTFHKKIFKSNHRNGVSKHSLTKLYSDLINLYHYIYIPVESSVHDILSLQSKELQCLMDKSITDDIKEIFDKKEHVHNEKKSKVSLVEMVNEKLDKFISNINERMSEGYRFEAKGAHKKTIKANDIVKVVIAEYFNIRPLTKENKGIRNLSSGQQRLALIDTATTLLASDNEKSREIILAIDEPESSLDSSQRFNQTQRLLDINKNHQHQILMTTHWYGLLLSTPKGMLIHISEGGSTETKIHQYPLQTFLNDRKQFPDSIEMKSFFDLATSIISILKSCETNWIICEGSSDALYLSEFLKNADIEAITLPLNGKGNIIKLFKLLSVPLEDKKERNTIKGRVLCIIDNDTSEATILEGYSSKKYDDKLAIKKLLINNENQEFQLTEASSRNTTKTTIEDILDPSDAWKSIMQIRSAFPELHNIDSLYEKNPDSKYSKLNTTEELLKTKLVEGYEKHKDIQNLINTKEFKFIFSKAYIENYKISNNTPKSFNSIFDFFKSNAKGAAHEPKNYDQKGQSH